METTVLQGTINLILTIIIYIGLILAAALLFDRKTRVTGLLGILMLVSLGSSIYAYSYWSMFQDGLESLVSSLLLPLLFLSISIALLIRVQTLSNNRSTKRTLVNELRRRLPLTIKIFVIVTIIYTAISSILEMNSNLLTPYLATVFVALFWEPAKKLH